MLDNRPFPELRKIVRELNDPRIWVHAEWVRARARGKGALVRQRGRKLVHEGQGGQRLHQRVELRWWPVGMGWVVWCSAVERLLVPGAWGLVGGRGRHEKLWEQEGSCSERRHAASLRLGSLTRRHGAHG